MNRQYGNYTIRSWQPEDRQAAADVIKNALAEYGLGWEPDGADRDVLLVEEYYLDRHHLDPSPSHIQLEQT